MKCEGCTEGDETDKGKVPMTTLRELASGKSNEEYVDLEDDEAIISLLAHSNPELAEEIRSSRMSGGSNLNSGMHAHTSLSGYDQVNVNNLS